MLVVLNSGTVLSIMYSFPPKRKKQRQRLISMAKMFIKLKNKLLNNLLIQNHLYIINQLLINY